MIENTQILEAVPALRERAFRLHAWRALEDPNRVPSIDLLRGLATVAVVLFHFGWLPYGYLGVDLFFVLSGLLVSRQLILELRQGKKIDLPKFLLSRGIKIWPSYYTMLLLGSGIAWLMYRNSRPDHIITFAHFPRYLFFYQNFRNSPHYDFDHVWSLCVEEHFYIMLPMLFLVVRSVRCGVRLLLALLILAILSGITAKQLGFILNIPTYASTPFRVDGLAWGVLLAVLLDLRRRPLRSSRGLFYIFPIAVAILTTAIWHHHTNSSLWFRYVAFHSLIPFGCFLLVLSVYSWRPPAALSPLRLIGYFSYNLYLWHPLFVHEIQDHFGDGAIGLGLYVTVSLFFAVVFTILVEEFFMENRKPILKCLLGRS
jgi:peptidoglycan/LPS O-acetylase OafA/YrhL